MLHNTRASGRTFPVIPRTIGTLFILSAFVIACASSALADGQGLRGGTIHGGGDGSFHGRLHGRGFHKRRDVGFGIVVGGYGDLGGYGDPGGYGTAGDLGEGDWYGISSGHDECPLFRQRVMTPDGWRVQLVPVC
jgi:hypothetical protein